MAAGTTLRDVLGLPMADDAARARARMRERFGDLLGGPSPSSEDLGACTGLPTHADIFGKTPCFTAWADEHYPDPEPRDDDWDVPWWIATGIAVGWFVWAQLDEPVSFDSGAEDWDIDGFEVDGLPWTVETLHEPGPPLAARVGEPLLHGGVALPGPGSPDVFIGGRPALTVAHAVAVCPRTTTLGMAHAPQARAWRTTNTSVMVNGEPLLRAGDCVMELPGGLDPIVGGVPTVLAGPRAKPALVQEERYVGLDALIDGLEYVGWTGATISLKASVRWNYQDVVKGVAAVGLFHLGFANPMLAPVTAWGAEQLLASMRKPEIELDLEVESGTIYAQTREDYESWGPGGAKHRTKRERWEFELPDFFDERSAEVDPARPWPPTKKDEKSGTRTKPIEES